MLAGKFAIRMAPYPREAQIVGLDSSRKLLFQDFHLSSMIGIL